MQNFPITAAGILRVSPAIARCRADGTEGAQADGVQGLILMSVLIATFAIPVVVGRRPEHAAYGRVLRLFFAFAGVYVFLLLFLYPRLF